MTEAEIAPIALAFRKPPGIFDHHSKSDVTGLIDSGAER